MIDDACPGRASRSRSASRAPIARRGRGRPSIHPACPRAEPVDRRFGGRHLALVRRPVRTGRGRCAERRSSCLAGGCARAAAAVRPLPGRRAHSRSRPAPDPRDRLRARIHPTIAWRTEVPIPVPGDRRAWDAVAMADDGWTGIEAISRLGASTRRFGRPTRSSAMTRGSPRLCWRSPTRFETGRPCARRSRPSAPIPIGYEDHARRPERRAVAATLGHRPRQAAQIVAAPERSRSAPR